MSDLVHHFMPVPAGGVWEWNTKTACGKTYRELESDLTAFVTTNFDDVDCEACVVAYEKPYIGHRVELLGTLNLDTQELRRATPEQLKDEWGYEGPETRLQFVKAFISDISDIDERKQLVEVFNRIIDADGDMVQVEGPPLVVFVYRAYRPNQDHTFHCGGTR